MKLILKHVIPLKSMFSEGKGSQCHSMKAWEGIVSFPD